MKTTQTHKVYCTYCCDKVNYRHMVLAYEESFCSMDCAQSHREDRLRDLRFKSKERNISYDHTMNAY